MSTVTSADAKAVVRAVEALTTQVGRIAKILSTPVVEVAEARPTTPDDGPRCVCGDPIEWYTAPGGGAGWIHSPGSDTPCTDARPACDVRGPWGDAHACVRPRGHSDDHEALDGCGWEQAPAAAEDVRTLSSPAWRPGEGYDRCPRVVAGLQCVFRAGHPPHGCTGSTSNPGTPTDEDAQRAARRDSMRNLLARLDRGGLLNPGDCTRLRQHVEAEVREADTARSVAAGNKRHVEVMYAELTQAQKRAEQAEELQRAAHETSNRAEAERVRLAAEVERLEGWCRTLSERATTAEAAHERVHGELAVNEADRVKAAGRARVAEAAIERVRAIKRAPTRSDVNTLANAQDNGWDAALFEVQRALNGTEQPTTEAP